MFNKNTIISFILGGIIFGLVGVYAATVSSSNVSYGSTSVEDALNDLYSISEKYTQSLCQNYNFDIINLHMDIYSTYTYKVSSNDTKYKKLLVFVSSINSSTVSNSSAFISPSGSKLSTIFNESVYQYLDSGNYVSNKLYVGEIYPVVESDSITLKGYYGYSVIIIGVK